jgi:hypothetical protein
VLRSNPEDCSILHLPLATDKDRGAVWRSLGASEAAPTQALSVKGYFWLTRQRVDQSSPGSGLRDTLDALACHRLRWAADRSMGS